MKKLSFREDAFAQSEDMSEFAQIVGDVAENSGYKTISVDGIKFPSVDVGLFNNLADEVKNGVVNLFGYEVEDEDLNDFIEQVEKSDHSLDHKGRKVLFHPHGESTFVERSGSYSRGYKNLNAEDRKHQVEVNCLATKEEVTLRHSYGVVTGTVSKDYAIIPQEKILTELMFDPTVTFTSGTIDHNFMTVNFTKGEYIGRLITSEVGRSSVLIHFFREVTHEGKTVKVPVLRALELAHRSGASIIDVKEGLEKSNGLLIEKEDLIQTLKDTPVMHHENAIHNLSAFLGIKEELRDDRAYQFSLNEDANLWDLYLQGSILIDEDATDTETKTRRLLTCLNGSFSWRAFDSLAQYRR